MMLPLVTCLEEVRQAKNIIAECEKELETQGKEYKSVSLGVMIETPSAVFISDLLAKEVDFFSIGTNDLTGYTMAVDRGNANVSKLYDSLQPSVLRAIEMTIKNAKRQVFRLVCAVKPPPIQGLYQNLSNGVLMSFQFHRKYFADKKNNLRI